MQLEISEKSNALANVLGKDNSFISQPKKCEEWDRLHKIVWEMEKQIEYFKKSRYRSSSHASFHK